MIVTASSLIRTFAAALFAAACSLSLRAAEADPGELIPPKAIYKVDPTHPQSLYDRGIEGQAVVIASIDMFGSVVDPVVDKATHDEFGLAALLATSEWIFEPATRNGVPVQVKVKIPFEFNISFEHKLNVEMGREVFQDLRAPVVPSFELDQAPLPSFVPAFVDFYPSDFRNTGQSAAISLEFIIDPNGDVVNPRVISTSTKGFEEAAIRAVSHMKYKTVKVHGQPAYVSLMMPIQLSE